jgi:hypothetical protein
LGDNAGNACACAMKNWHSIRGRAVNSLRVDPQPFAGDTPTRWRIVGEYSVSPAPKGYDRTFSYIGKPNRTIARRVQRLISNAVIGVFRAWEYDRGGNLLYGEVYCPRGDFRVSSIASNIAHFYYPWEYVTGSMVTNWHVRQMHRTPIVFQGKKTWIYTAHPGGEYAQGDWEMHRTWLENAHIQFGKPQSTSTK